MSPAPTFPNTRPLEPLTMIALNHTATASLTALRHAEAGLCRALHSAADAIDAVGTQELDHALARLEAAAEGARARLAGAMYRLSGIVAGLTATMEGLAADVHADVERSTVRSRTVEQPPAGPTPS